MFLPLVFNICAMRYPIIFVLLVILTGCKKEETQPEEPFCQAGEVIAKGNRLLGIDILDPTETGSFNYNVGIVKQIGTDFTTAQVKWSDIEPAPYNYQDAYGIFTSFNRFLPSAGLKLSLTINPIDASGKIVPADLESHRFSDTTLINRFKAMVDFAFTKIDFKLLSNIMIGNEIDDFDHSGEPPEFWQDYQVFLTEIIQHLHLNYPGLPVGFTAELDGLLEQSHIFNPLSKVVDLVGVIYYPNYGYEVMPPDIIFSHLNDLIENYPNTLISFQEIGYQTSSKNKSTEEDQAKFFCNFFRVWDQHNKQIIAANIVRLNDVSMEDARRLATPYGIQSEGFIEYLRTLGLRTYPGLGQNKMAFDIIKENVQARGW